MKRSTVSFLILFFVFQSSVVAQEQRPPYWNEIEAFKKTDSANPPPPNAILFVGSSSFRLWKDIDNAFPNHAIINRGFGGSSLPHVIQYAEDIIFPYQPKQVVVYCGENDMTAETATGDTVYQRFKNLFTLIRSRLTNVPVVFVSLKPSPSRWHLKEKMERGNRLIKEFLKKEKNTAFVDVWNPMLTSDGMPREELFVADRLHMNEKGYAIWTKKIKPHLKK
jgi:lysophospholipase L1-like esterase